MDNQAQKKNSANYGCFLMIVLQVIIACLLAETRAIATRCVRGDDVFASSVLARTWMHVVSVQGR